MKVTKFTVLVATVLATGILSVAGYAETVTTTTPLIDSDFENSLVKHFEKRFFNRIDATSEQRHQLSEAISSRINATRPMREELRRQILDLTQLMADKDATDEQIIAKAHEVQEFSSKMVDERLKTALAVRSLLTQDQRQQISDQLSGLISGQWKPRFRRAI